jgi:hypothetical protein
MINVFIEATNGPRNWGKFMVARFVEEWLRGAEVSGQCSLLRAIGWDHPHLIVFDLQTGEGGIFRPGGSAVCDLNKHKIWVCPMFEPFLVWLYKQDLTDLTKLPKHIDLPDAPFEMQGYRRRGERER